MLSDRVRKIEMSPTLRISALAGELRAAGEDVLDFSAGQPDFPTPERVKEAGAEAIRQNRTGYTANQGLVELRGAVADRLRRDLELDYAVEQILISPGAKASLYFASQALFGPGDEVLIPTPYWVTYPEQTRLAEATPVFVPCSEERGFKLSVEDLERARTPRTRGLLLNYPGNPTGACYGRAELEPLGRFAVEHDLWIVADEIYGQLLFDGRTFTSIAQLGPEVRERTVLIDGMSKTYSMTGWRIGYSAATREVTAAMAKLQSHTTSNATSISQWASIEALALERDELERRVVEFQRRRDRIVSRLCDLPGVRCVIPEGSFYAFPNVSGLFGNGLTCGGDLAEYLLREARVAVVPGEAFGSPEHVRLSYAVGVERIDEGMKRIADALARLGA